MALALVGRDSLDVLEGLVREKFSAIRDKEEGREGGREDAVEFNNPFPPRFMPLARSSSSSNGSNANGSSSNGKNSSASHPSSLAAAAAAAAPPPPAEQEAATPLIRIVPLRDKRELLLSWPLPPSRPHYRSPPTRLLSHLLGHEGEGSIFSVLHRVGWASGVHAGLGTSQEDFCLFECTVALTEEGQRHWQDVASLVFQYVQLIAQAPPGTSSFDPSLPPSIPCVCECTVALMEEGQRHWQDVASLVFQYVRLIGLAPAGKPSFGPSLPSSLPPSLISYIVVRDHFWSLKRLRLSIHTSLPPSLPPPLPLDELSAIWGELRVISSTSFRFQQKAQEYSYASDLARRLQHYQVKHILSGGHLFDGLDLAALEECLAGMTEEKALIFLICKENDQQQQHQHQHQQQQQQAPSPQKQQLSPRPPQQKQPSPSSSSSSSSSSSLPPSSPLLEPWYQIPYSLTLLPSHTLRSWTCAHIDSLHLPRSNPFIAEEFDILSPLSSFEPPSATPSPPQRVLQTSSVEVWHKLDCSYGQPRAYIILDFASPLVQRDPGAAELLVRYVEHALQESTYDALVAGLGWSISTSSNGLALRYVFFYANPSCGSNVFRLDGGGVLFTDSPTFASLPPFLPHSASPASATSSRHCFTRS